MIRIVSQIGTLPDQTIATLFRNKTNLINIIFKSEQSQPAEVRINRSLFLKGCGSEELAEACKNGDEQIVLESPQYLIDLLQVQQNQLALRQFIRYLVSGKLEFQTKMFSINFVLACVFNVRLFFNSIIDQGIRIPIENQQFRNILCNCCFDFFTNILNEDGKYNFVWWVFRKYKINWFHIMENQFSENMTILNSFILEYTTYKVENNELISDDVLELMNMYKITGKSAEDAKNKIKKTIKWESVSIKVLQDNAKTLKFTDQQVKAILQKRLSKIQSTKGKQINLQLQQLQQKRDVTKTRFQNIISMNAANKLRKILYESGVTPVDNRQQQFLKKSNQKMGLNSYQNLDQSCYPQPAFNNNPYIQQSNIHVNKDQQCLLQQQIQILLNSQDTFNKPNFTKKQDPKSYNHKPSRTQPKKSKNPIAHELENCDFNKSIDLQCGCSVCQSCIKNRYINRTQKYEGLDNNHFQFQLNDLQRYKICCYQCNKQLDEIDAITYNSL